MIIYRITIDEDDFGGKKTYIATQGCLASTRADFWQMVWQVRKIITVICIEYESKFVESNKHFSEDSNPEKC
jgi:protein tyrosine phosphatase